MPLQPVFLLDSHRPANNSFFEFATFHAYQGVRARGCADVMDAFMSLTSAPYSLADLEHFVSGAGPHRTLREAQPSVAWEIRRAAIRERPHYAFKLREMAHLSWTATGYEPPSASASAQELDGTIHTGFIQSEPLALAVREFWRMARDLACVFPEERRDRWGALVQETSDLGGVNPARISALLCASPLSYARRLYRRLQPKSPQVDLIIQPTEDDMAAYLARRKLGRDRMRRQVEATFELPDREGGRPKLVLLAPEEIEGGDAAEALSDFTSTVLHEDLHVQRGFRAVIEESFFAHEMEAYLVGASLQMLHGYLTGLNVFGSLSPFGPVMGLRNFVEHAHIRQKPLYSAATAGMIPSNDFRPFGKF